MRCGQKKGGLKAFPDNGSGGDDEKAAREKKTLSVFLSSHTVNMLDERAGSSRSDWDVFPQRSIDATTAAMLDCSGIMPPGRRTPTYSLDYRAHGQFVNMTGVSF